MTVPTVMMTVTMPLPVWTDTKERRKVMKIARNEGMPALAKTEGMTLTGYPQSHGAVYIKHDSAGQVQPTDALDADSVQVLLIATAWPSPATLWPPQ